MIASLEFPADPTFGGNTNVLSVPRVALPAPDGSFISSRLRRVIGRSKSKQTLLKNIRGVFDVRKMLVFAPNSEMQRRAA